MKLPLLLLLVACSPDQKTDRPISSKIDSSVEISSLESIGNQQTVREFLISLGLCEKGDDDESILNLIQYVDTESSVNQYVLNGGGGVGFTTRLNASGRKVGDSVFSAEILEDVVTSFDFYIGGENRFYSLKEGKYNLKSEP